MPSFSGETSQALIPLGLKAVGMALEAEVVGLGRRPVPPPNGWTPLLGPLGAATGSVYLVDQELPIPVPRVRDRVANRGSPLTTYEQLQVPWAADAGLFRKVLVGMTC